MVREHTPEKPTKDEPIYIEREVTLSLVNQKINAVLENQELIKEALKIESQ